MPAGAGPSAMVTTSVEDVVSTTTTSRSACPIHPSGAALTRSTAARLPSQARAGLQTCVYVADAERFITLVPDLMTLFGMKATFAFPSPTEQKYSPSLRFW